MARAVTTGWKLNAAGEIPKRLVITKPTGTKSPMR